MNAHTIPLWSVMSYSTKVFRKEREGIDPLGIVGAVGILVVAVQVTTEVAQCHGRRRRKL